MISLVEIGPHPAPAGALVGNDKVSVLMLPRELNFDILSRIEPNGLIGFHEFACRNQRLGFAANIHHSANVRDRHDPALDNLSFCRSLLGRRILVH